MSPIGDPPEGATEGSTEGPIAHGVSARAVVLTSGGLTELRQVTVPRPEIGEVSLDLRVCGLCGTDLFKLAHSAERTGAVLGHELVGTVRDDPSGARTGERVVVPHHVACGECAYCRRGSETMCEEFRRDLLYPGGFCEHVLVRRRAVEHALRTIPDHLDDSAAVFLEPAACVLRGIERGGLARSGARVAILGAGSMGLLHLLVIKAIDPQARVLVIEPNDERRRLACELGADRVAHPTVSDDGTDLESWAREIAGPDLRYGVDVAFDTVGGSRGLESGLAVLREGGTLVLFAHDLGATKPDIDWNRLFKSEQRIVGTYSGSLAEQRRVFDLLTAGTLDPSPLVSHRLPLSQFDRAVELCRSQAALKVLLEPDR